MTITHHSTLLNVCSNQEHFMEIFVHAHTVCTMPFLTEEGLGDEVEPICT